MSMLALVQQRQAIEEPAAQEECSPPVVTRFRCNR
jgi:hypothetical protein